MLKRIPINLNKAKVEFLKYDDWEVIQIDGEPYYEDHHLSPSEWIEFIERAFGIKINYQYIEEAEE